MENSIFGNQLWIVLKAYRKIIENDKIPAKIRIDNSEW